MKLPTPDTQKAKRARQWFAAKFTEETHWWVELRGNSMSPTIPAGSRVRIHAGIHPTPGEVGAYRCERGLVVHRLVQARTDFLTGRRIYLFHGDALNRPDGPVAPEDLVGVVTAIRPPTWAWRIRTALYRWRKSRRGGRAARNSTGLCGRNAR